MLAELFASQTLGGETRQQSAARIGDAFDLTDPEQRKLGRYELIEKLGEGGMGVVFRAHEPALNRDVALKIIGAGIWATAQYLARFRIEAQSAAKLFHPGIVPIFEINQADDLMFFTMALIEGETLAQRIKRDGVFADQKAAALTLGLAEAAHYAHQLGVLHLDLKPANVLIDAKGSAYIADFGLARSVDEGQVNTEQTSAGTPGYMAPEQIDARRGPLDRRSDVYGLGGVLYAMLIGQAPHAAASSKDSKQAALTQAVKLHKQLRAGIAPAKIAPDLAAICEKALARDPAQRYADASLMAEDLRSFLSHRPVLALHRSALSRFALWCKRDAKLAAALSLLGVALLVGLAASLYQAQEAKRAALRSQVDASNARKMSSFLTTMLSAADPVKHRGNPLTAVQLLDQARDRIENNEFAEQPELNAELHLVMAKSYRGQSRIDDCVALATNANVLATKALAASDASKNGRELLLQARLTQADCMIQKSQLNEAIVLLEQNMSQFQYDAALALPLMESSILQARALWLSSRRPAARRLMETLLQNPAPQQIDAVRVWARAQFTLARILDEDGEKDPAIGLMQAGIASTIAADGADAPAVLSAQIELGQLQIMQACTSPPCPSADTRTGFTLMDRSIADMMRVLGKEHIAVALALNNRGDARQMTGDDRAALADYQLAGGIADRVSLNSRFSLNYHFSVADSLLRLRRFDEAASAYLEVEKRLITVQGMNPEALQDYRNDLAAGRCGIRRKDPQRAIRFRTKANLVGCD